MLRSARGGLDSKKTTNFDAMRDLSGRRMRHVNNEQKLRDWANSADQRKADAEREKREARERKAEEARVKDFIAAKCTAAVDSVRETVEDGVAVGIIAARKRAREQKEAARRKLEGHESPEPEPKKAKMQAPATEPQSNSVAGAVAAAAAQSSFTNTAHATPATAPQVAVPKPGPLEWQHYKGAGALLKGCGAEAIKSELERMQLKCGGTPEQRAERLFSTKGKALSEIDPRLFAKKKGGTMRMA
jgi:hypothetical protein